MTNDTLKALMTDAILKRVSTGALIAWAVGGLITLVSIKNGLFGQLGVVVFVGAAFALGWTTGVRHAGNMSSRKKPKK